MTPIISELPDLRFKKILSTHPLVYEAAYIGKNTCPHCHQNQLKLKDSFWRHFKSGLIFEKCCSIKVRCHKYQCLTCHRYFNTRISGIKPWSRSTEPLKRSVFAQYNKGLSITQIAQDFQIGTATVERYYQQMTLLENRKINPQCPKILGIDEHRFTRKQGFATTFCDLKNHKIFDTTLGRSEAALKDYLLQLKGKNQVKIICMDLNKIYRSIAKQWFPKAKIVADRFHVIRLINERFKQWFLDHDNPHLAYNRQGLMRLMTLQKTKLTDHAKKRLDAYFNDHPQARSIYHLWQNLTQLLRNKHKNTRECQQHISTYLQYIQLLKLSDFEPLRRLSKTLTDWKEEILRMFRYTYSNGMTEGFHRKMKLIQRKAYGFRNFENYRLRVRVLCGH